MKILKKVVLATKILTIGIFFFVFLAILPYFNAEIYDFKEKTTFSGMGWFNPYLSNDSLWLKANFHAHTFAWGKLTNGHHTSEEVLQKFISLGYDIPTISNYHSIDTIGKLFPTILYIPTYEHGYNIKKRHHQPLGATSVVWLDFIFGQTIHHKQYMLNRIAPTCSVLTINHPSFSNGFDPSDFSMLRNYDLIEVLNHYRTSIPHWDSALSAGIPSMIVSNDDMKHLGSDGECGAFWTMINVPEKSAEYVYASLRSGKAYGVRGLNAKNGDKLQSVIVRNDSLSVEVSTIADSIRFIHQNGVIKERFSTISKATIPLLKEDTYVRTEIFLDSNTTYYLNPVYRSVGKTNNMNFNFPTVNTFFTILYRFGLLVLEGIVILGIWALLKSCRKKKIDISIESA